jgi:hypothetical protein
MNDNLEVVFSGSSKMNHNTFHVSVVWLLKLRHWHLSYLKSVNFETVSCHTSNHKNAKQLPVFLRYFRAYDLEDAVKNRFLTLGKTSGVSADIISMHVMKAIDNYDSQTKVVGLSTDNVIRSFIHQWLYSPCGPWSLILSLNLHTVGTISWTGNQPVARQLPTHRITQTE